MGLQDDYNDPTDVPCIIGVLQCTLPPHHTRSLTYAAAEISPTSNHQAVSAGPIGGSGRKSVPARAGFQLPVQQYSGKPVLMDPCGTSFQEVSMERGTEG